MLPQTAPDLDLVLAPPRADEQPRPVARIKGEPDHFQVTEIPAHPPGGDGAHLWLEVERRDMNTGYVARILARVLGVAVREVGYAGLKDRHALARQWFSAPVADPSSALVDELEAAGLRVIACARNARKLQRGALAGNRFRILVQIDDADAAALECACQRIARDGVPNYFGPQRFGHRGQNVQRAREMLCAGVRVRDRYLRGLYLSAARSALFNTVLAARVTASTWRRLLPGEVVALDGSASFFVAGTVDAALEQRLHAFDVHPTGPLWGDGPSPARDEAAAVELAALRGCEPLLVGLAAARLEHARRALRAAVTFSSVRPVPGVGWWIEFTLPPGTYATVVLREAFELHDASAPGADQDG